MERLHLGIVAAALLGSCTHYVTRASMLHHPGAQLRLYTHHERGGRHLDGLGVAIHFDGLAPHGLKPAGGTDGSSFWNMLPVKCCRCSQVSVEGAHTTCDTPAR